MTIALPKRHDAPTRISDLNYVRACCEHWARVYMSSAYDSISSTGRLMAGMSTNCPCRGIDPKCHLCDGTGRVSGELADERYTEWKKCTAGCVPVKEKGKTVYRIGPNECLRCRGLGRRRILHRIVSPASIPSTVDVGGKHVGDRIYHVIEQVVRSWRERDETVWLNRVTVREYLHNGTQKMKAKRLRISTSWYEKSLHEAHFRLEAVLRPE